MTAAGERDDATSLEGRFATIVWLLGLAALATRLVLQRFEPLPPSKKVVADEVWYARVAHSVVHGHGFALSSYTGSYVQTALHGPLTVLLLLPASVVQPYGYTAQRATIALLGALAVVVIGYAGRELGGARVGVLAAILALAYPGLWVNDLVATSETPAVLLLAVILLLTLRYRRRPSTAGLVSLGLATGLLALDRAELAVLGLLLAVPALVAASRSVPNRAAALVRSLAVVGVLAVGVVVPWSAYNQARFHQTVLISNNLGQTLVGANCPQSYYGPLTGYDGNTCFLPVLYRVPHGLNEAGVDSYFRHEAVHYALAHWHRWPVVAVMRELWLWSLWRPGWTVFMSGIYLGRPQWIAWTQVVTFWLLAPLAIYGLVVARRRKVPVAALVTMVAFTAALGLLVVGHLRYRIPTEIAFVLLGSVALDELLFARRARAAAN